MSGPAPTPRRRALVVVLILLGPAITLVMQVLGYEATAEPSRPEIAWTTLHAAVAFVFAGSAIVAYRVGEPRLPVVLMAIMGYLWIPQTFFSVIAGLGGVWPLLRSIDLVWALALGLLANAYPRGVFRGRTSAILLVLGIGVSVIRFLAVILLDQPDQPDCECAPNIYAIAEDPELFAGIDLGYRVIGAGIIMFVAGRLFWHWFRSSAPARTVAFVMPIGLIAWTAALVVEAVSYAMTRPDAGHLVVTSATVGPVAIVSLFAVASVPICYVAGSLHIRAMRGRVADLMGITREGVDRSVWRSSLATTLQDPGVEVYWWDEEDGVYRDEGDGVVDLPLAAGEPSRTLLPIDAADGTPVAVIRHDRALSENDRLLDGVSAALRLAVDNGKLRSELERNLEDVRESRQRIVEAANEARKRLERDLHDGSQQQLVALSMELRTICTAARQQGASALAEELEEAITRLATALRELRQLAHGIHPTVLAEGGLELAMRELAGRSPIPVDVEAEGELGRGLPELIESTAYFVASEGLVNAAKHSRARQVWLRVEGDGERVRMTIRDNGIGGASELAGTGILGLVDRVDAVGGSLRIRSPRGEGTTIEVELPLASPVAAV
ncbi:sensor histidine kinase [Homoserinibacter sp. YIM 151385]|uniref:sensor histidine kinase n=1 Tax=Homoserinibacter sp. YIM 151385 TaxID=2985506 RepID=UPI0022F06AE5|nr:sensor histidine kinase [Homoserinibacter sp. YIM 151385]WBU36788.1 sensor histidine kinase [Homoserinibacter sp. YIM 151385]